MIEEDRDCQNRRGSHEKTISPKVLPISSQSFKEGDLVLKKIELKKKPTHKEKLVMNLEGLYQVIKEVGKGVQNT